MAVAYPDLFLKVSARPEFLPAVTQCVETAAVYFGLGKNESLKLRLASEEIFSYLCERVCRGHSVEMICRSGLFFARVEFQFSVSALDMGALNLPATLSPDDDDDLMQMGLVIASRTVDRLFISKGSQNAVMLAVEQDKTYPPADAAAKAIDARGALTVIVPNAEDAQRFALQMNMGAQNPLSPAFFSYPGKVADMVASGYCRALAVRDEGEKIAGGLLYRTLTAKTIEVYAPCIFDPSRGEEIAGLLMDACIAATARTKAVGLVSLTGLPASVQPQFESLGAMRYVRPPEAPLVAQASIRLLHEDPGCQVWAHADLKDYLEKKYAGLFLARDILDARALGDSQTGASIFSTEIRREKSEAFLRPLWPGRDPAENLDRHLAFCRRESLENIFFALDLGISWHAHLVPILMAQSFAPSVMIPFAGQADVVIFQYDESES